MDENTEKPARDICVQATRDADRFELDWEITGPVKQGDPYVVKLWEKGTYMDGPATSESDEATS